MGTRKTSKLLEAIHTIEDAGLSVYREGKKEDL